MELLEILYAIIGVCVVFWSVITIFICRYYKKNKLEFENRKKSLKQNTLNDNANQPPTTENSIPTETFNQNDLPISPLTFTPKESQFLQQDLNYIVGKKGSMREGKYIISSADENVSSFDMMLGEYTKTYNNGDTIVLKNGESITPITCSVNLITF
ncbi:MAG: hypothetical protein IJW82_07205 [Clostridia bacterium]|nr:hypothetical protein [Clostridia bacterium]